MNLEMGSEFWDIPTSDKRNSFFPEHTQWYLAGRTALKSIINELQGLRSVALPSWCCDSMIAPFMDAGFDVKFYPFYRNIKSVVEAYSDCDVLFVMDYFGYTSEPVGIEEYNGIVIRDVTHSIFSSSYSDADYYFGSLRKWCGVWTGGFAWTGDEHQLFQGNDDKQNYTALRQKAMIQKQAYITGKRTDKDYLDIFSEAEALLDHLGVIKAAERDIDAAYHLDLQTMVSSRRKNAKVLRSAFHNYLVFPDIKNSDCPMFVPILVPDMKRDTLRQHLIQNKIYCPIHWPMNRCLVGKIDDRTEAVYKNALSLICDQRYTEDDMDRMVKTVKEFLDQ